MLTFLLYRKGENIVQRKILIWVWSIREKTRENKRKQEIDMRQIKISKKAVDFHFYLWYNCKAPDWYAKLLHRRENDIVNENSDKLLIGG